MEGGQAMESERDPRSLQASSKAEREQGLEAQLPVLQGATMTGRVVDEVLEIELHHGPCNEIGFASLEDFEKLGALLHAPALGDASPRLGAPASGTGGPSGLAGVETARPWRAVLLYSSQPHGFCAGADLRALSAGLEQHALRSGNEANGESPIVRVREFLVRIHRAFDQIDAAPVPVIAATHGFCFGGGFELALVCDLVVADRSTRFCFPELRLGLIPGFGGIPRLRRELPEAVIRDLLLSGRSLNAKRAHELGLIAQCVSKGQHLFVARQLAHQLTLFDPTTAAAAKRFIKRIPHAELEEERALFLTLFQRPEVRKALRAFTENDGPRPYLPATS